MSGTVEGRPVDTSWTEYGVKFNNGDIYQADDKEDAEFFAGLWEGEVIARSWYGTGWLAVNASA